MYTGRGMRIAVIGAGISGIAPPTSCRRTGTTRYSSRNRLTLAASGRLPTRGSAFRTPPSSIILPDFPWPFTPRPVSYWDTDPTIPSSGSRPSRDRHSLATRRARSEGAPRGWLVRYRNNHSIREELLITSSWPTANTPVANIVPRSPVRSGSQVTSSPSETSATSGFSMANVWSSSDLARAPSIWRR